MSTPSTPFKPKKTTENETSDDARIEEMIRERSDANKILQKLLNKIKTPRQKQ